MPSSAGGGAQAITTGSRAACAPTWLRRHQRGEGPKPACSGSPQSPTLLGGLLLSMSSCHGPQLREPDSTHNPNPEEP